MLTTDRLAWDQQAPSADLAVAVHDMAVADVGAPPRVRVAVSGELDLWTGPLLAATLEGLIERGRTHLDLDLRELSFCDATGLNLLVSTAARARGAGGRLVVHGPCPAVQLLLDILPDVGIRVSPAR